MHTSYGNAIYLRDTSEETTRKVMGMYTDPTRLHPTDPGHVEGNPVFAMLDVFHADKAELAELKSRYKKGTVGDVEVKRILADSLNAYLAPIRERRAELFSQPKLLLEVLYGGTVRAKFEAQKTLEEVYEKMGLLHNKSISEKALAKDIGGVFC
jgi:tryptophanyl-tRNA synthetase